MASHPADLPMPPPRPREASKRDFGRVLVIGGSSGMAGAPALAGMAALRSGAGLVDLVVPESVAAIAASFDPCLMTRGFPSGAGGGFAAAVIDEVLERSGAASAVAIGPGLGRSEDVAALATRLWREFPGPAVFDADALWALAVCGGAGQREHAGPRVVTPHAGEMLRLAGRDPAAAASRDRPRLVELATDFARAARAVVVLKGAGTRVIEEGREAVNETGNVGLATAGTGDVLTGVVGGLLAQGMEPFAAARLGVWVHGTAGDAAAADLGTISMTARDLLDRLHVAFTALVPPAGRAG
jgi:hydroxyethylthiazole kinase-like uncharacterized protein yjeF